MKDTLPKTEKDIRQNMNIFPNPQYHLFNSHDINSD